MRGEGSDRTEFTGTSAYSFSAVTAIFRRENKLLLN
jgi:hypothetical protein